MATTTKTTTQTRQTTNTNPTNAVGSIQHLEIVTKDPVKLQKFLETCFGWKFDVQPMPGTGANGPKYHMFRTPDGNGGGVMAPTQANQPLAVTPYITVNDCNAAEKTCKKNGATILMPTQEIPGMGWFFVFQFPNSPPLACYQGTTNTNTPGRN